MSARLDRGLVAAVAVKALLVVAGLTMFSGDSRAFEHLDRAANFGLLVIAGIWVARFVQLASYGGLWKVSRKLVLSYVLVGAVPILLLTAFSLLVLLLVFFDISSYLVQNRFERFTEQVETIAKTTLFEVERAPSGSRDEVISRRQAALQTQFPDISIVVVPIAGDPGCGLPPSRDVTSPQVNAMPRWVSCRGFRGIVVDGRSSITNVLPMLARAVALPETDPAYAVVVDLKVDKSLAAESLHATGISVGEDRPRALFNTATFLTYTDWQNGLTAQATLPMSVHVGMLYRSIGGSQGGASFNRVLLYVVLGVGALLLVIEMVALGHGLALARTITASVDELFGGTERVKGGDFRHPIPVRSRDQLGELAVSFNEMTSSIDNLLVEQQEKRRLEEELRIARDIQMSLLPQGPLSVPGLSVAALCVPAHEVGGDYYDWLPLSDGRFGLLIADVAGKGTSAALYMAELKGLMLSLSRIHTSPRALLVDANRIISHHLDSRSFITMIYAVVDLEAKRLTCARAGHAPFIRIPEGPDGERRARVLAPDGIVLGLNVDGGERFERSLQEVTLPLQSGDLYFFFTDGVSEAMDRQGACFGESRLTAFLEGHAGLPVEAVRDRLVEEVERFVDGQPQHDDITMIILKVGD